MTVRAAGTLLAASLALGAVAQTRRPLSGNQQTDYYSVVNAFPWDVEKLGPLISVCPLRIVNGSTLEEIGRKKVSIGNLTAIVPTKMVTLNSRFTEAPNLYEGLPQEAKVMYLLRSLTAEQWNKVSGTGLSIADCQGEQAAVFDSIVPKPFVYTVGTVLTPNSITNSLEKIELSEAKRRAIKLRTSRHLDLILPLSDDRGFTGTGVNDDMVAGTKLPMISGTEGEEFGQKLRIESDNVPRKSQLELGNARFSTIIPFKNTERLGELLARVATATGIELHVDPHYGPMVMLEKGTGATAREILQAVSYGVTGTYRRLGTAYVLTNDLEGIAAHAARIAAWEDDLTKLVQEREDQWRVDITKGGGLSSIKFNPGAFDTLTQTEQDNLKENERQDNDNRYMNVAQASAPIQQAIKSFGNGGLNLDREKVGISSSIRYEIILPDGLKLWNTGWVGNTNMFKKEAGAWFRPDPAPVALPLAVTPKLQGLLLRADSPSAAQGQIKLAKELGLSDLWIETASPETLAAAVEAGKTSGVNVTLAFRPWALAPGESIPDPDRTTSGDHGKSLAAAKAGYLSWQNVWRDNNAFEPPTYELVSPLDPSTSARSARWANLASVKGLSGVALLDLFPNGYANATSRSSGSFFYSEAVDTLLAYGYTENQRLTFLRKEGVDPVDLLSNGYRKVSLQEAWGDAFAYGTGQENWQHSKGMWAHEASLNLLKAIAASNPTRPIFLQPQAAEIHIPPYSMNYYSRWQPGTDIALSPVDYSGDQTAKACDVKLLTIADTKDLVQQNRVANQLKTQLAKSEKPIVLDLTSVPASRLAAILKRWIQKAE